ncbi:hypothetical protein AALP_AA5G283500 [Arabis alpina]|uniref:RRM domain-containing protein n=1 Tax=Arabis alpina TaxID=50452 RepID=A0A087GZX8_ARAAL|nr:hypothetical protein AALP_AA5G283500 [Arabis alpina]
MFTARVRSSLIPLFHGRHSSSLIRNREIGSISKRISHSRFNDGEWTLFRTCNRTFHSSLPKCYSSEFDVGVKALKTALFRSLEDDDFSELGSVKKDGDHNTVVKLLTSMREPSQKKKKKKKNKKKHGDEASDSISKLKLLTEKPELSWLKTNGKSKTEAPRNVTDSPARNVTDSPARNVTDSNVLFSELSKSLSSTQDHISEAQNIIRPSSEAKKETSSKGSNYPASVVVIRIGNLNSKTTDSMIHSMCLSIGPLGGIARANDDTCDVFFRVKTLKEADSVLEELNDACVDQSQWTAEIVPEEEVSIDQMGKRISSSFKDFEKQLLMRRILAKDLEILLHSVMHLENHPIDQEGTKALGSSQEA